MKKRILLCLSLLGISVGLLSAQVERTMPQQGTYPALTEQNGTTTQGDPDINFVWDNLSSAKKGVRLFGSTIEDRTTFPSIIHLFSKKLSEITRLAPVTDNNPYKSIVLHCGTYTGSKYIGYVVTIYTYQILPNRFVQIDTNTGEITSIEEYNENSTEYREWPTMYELAYDHTTQKCWGFGRSKRTDKAVSAIYTIDTNTGAFSFVQDLEVYVFAAAYNLDGKLYAIVGKANAEGNYVGSEIVELNPNDNFKEVANSRKEIKKDGNPIVPNYTHTADFDHTTGDLYWMASDKSSYQYGIKIDPVTGASTTLGLIGFGDVVSALYIPYETAETRKAPARVENLQATYKDGKPNQAIVTWTNPTKTWDKETLASISKVTVARDSRDNVVASLSGANQPGTQSQWLDVNATQGIHTYYVTAFNDKKGVVDSIRCYIGEDIPGVVENISNVKTAPTTLWVSWSAPSKGAHDGWIDPSKVTYTVVRMPDKKIVADNLTEKSFTDNTLGEVMRYSYVIIPKNNIGKGVPAESEKILAGTAYSVPYKTDFATQEEVDSWSVVDANNDGNRFSYSGGGFQDFERMALDPAGYEKAADDWLFSPNINLRAGRRYEITIQPQIELANSIHSFSINIGKEAKPEAQKEIEKFEDYTVPTPGLIKKEVVTVDITEDASYNIGIHCTSIGSMDTRDLFSVQGVSIKELYKKDLSVEDFNILELINDQENKVVIKVYNEGSEDQSAYTVRLLQMVGDKANVLAETNEVPLVKSKESVECTLKYRPTQEGKTVLAAEVILEDDGDMSNNRSKGVEVKILPAGTVPWSHLVTSESISHQTTLPMSFSRQYSVGQTTYYAEEIGLNEDATITRLAYDYINGIASDDDVDVKIYLANVDRKDLTGLTVAEACMKPEDMVLVYDGQIGIKEGTNRMEFNFDTPFEYKKDKHLCVQVWKDGTTSESYPAQFVIFDQGSGVLRSMRYMSRNPLSPENPSAQATLLLDWVPQLRLAIKTKTGVQEVVVGSSIAYNATTKMLQFGDFKAKAIRVYDVKGQLLLQKSVPAGSDGVVLDLESGVYVVTAQGVDGSVVNTKINVIQ